MKRLRGLLMLSRPSKLKLVIGLHADPRERHVALLRHVGAQHQGFSYLSWEIVLAVKTWDPWLKPVSLTR